jgi:hypothetical protein
VTAAWLHRLGRWTWRDYALLGEVFAAALLVEIAIRSMSMVAILRVIDRVPASRPPADAATLDANRLARFAAAPYRFLALHGTCLRESLVLSMLLRRRDVPAAVCFGVRHEGGLTAHAWVATSGIPTDAGTLFHELRGAWSD